MDVGREPLKVKGKSSWEKVKSKDVCQELNGALSKRREQEETGRGPGDQPAQHMKVLQ